MIVPIPDTRMARPAGRVRTDTGVVFAARQSCARLERAVKVDLRARAARRRTGHWCGAGRSDATPAFLGVPTRIQLFFRLPHTIRVLVILECHTMRLFRRSCRR
jgi:hypothetical protein